jgi:two-component system sensor kinase FixL
MTHRDPLDASSTTWAALRWFVHLRWAAGLAIVGGSLLAGAVGVGPDRLHLRFLALGACVLAANVVLWLVMRRLAPSAGAAQRLAWGQLVPDLLCLTLATLWTGGIASPVAAFFIPHMVLASLLLPARVSFAVAVLAMAMLLAGLALSGAWPAEQAQIVATLSWMLLLVVTVYLTNRITRDLRLRDRALNRQAHRTDAILATAVDAIITIDERGIIQSVNPATERLFGYAAAELLGGNVSLLMPEPDRSRHDGYLGRYLNGGQARIIGIGREVEGRRRDGSTFPADLAVSEVRLPEGRLFTGVIRDVTERKRAEAELRHLNEELRRQQQALIQSEKMTAMGQMAAGLTHEISNPLANMDSLLQLVQRQPTRLDGKVGEQLREQVDRIARMVRQMTDFAHPHLGGWQRLPINPLVNAAIDMVRLDHRLRRIALEVELAPEAGEADVIPHAIQQVLVNLLRNAIDALDQTERPRLTVRTALQGPWRQIVVADNGPGIAAQDLDHIFEPFFTTKPLGQGTGLGLSISYSLVQRHGGRIEVESGPAGGATFRVCLPQSRPQEPGAGPLPESGNRGG